MKADSAKTQQCRRKYILYIIYVKIGAVMWNPGPLHYAVSLAQTCDPPASASQSTGVTGTRHHTQLLYIL